MNAAARSALLAVLIAAVLGACAPGALAADAASYTVWSCRGPDGAPAATTAWQSDAGDSGAGDGCATGGALSATLTGGGVPASGRVSGWRFMAPAGTVVTGYRIALTAATAAEDAHERWAGPQAGVATGPLLGPLVVTAGCTSGGCAFGDPSTPLSVANLVTAGGLPAPALALVARCGRRCGDSGTTVARAQLWRSAVDVADDADPILGAPSGSLLDPGVLSGRVSVAAQAGDSGGGVTVVALLVDGAEAQRIVAGGACAQPYVVVAPCPATLPARFEVDTRTLTAGAHTAALSVTDAAGRVTTGEPIAFSVSNPAAGAGAGGGGGAGGGVLGGSPVTVTVPALAAHVLVDHRRFDLPAKGAQVTGVVRRADGSPAPGAQLEVRSRPFGAGSGEGRLERTLATGADGRFAFAVGSSSRRLVVRLVDPGYRPADSPEVRVVGDLAVKLSGPGGVLHNGSKLRLSARIAGAGLGAVAGRAVLIQALIDGHWTTVDSVEAGVLGRATWRYRFRNTTRSTTYRFRARVPRGGADWPWPATVSNVVGVRVLP